MLVVVVTVVLNPVMTSIGLPYGMANATPACHSSSSAEPTGTPPR
jgi:hypothetical protein